MPLSISLRRAAALLAGAAAMAALAAPSGAPSIAPPPWPAPQGGEAAAASDPVRPLLIGPVRITFDATSLHDVQAALGVGEIVHQGNGTEALDLLCYTLPDAEPAQRLWLTSSELGGGSRIDGATAVEIDAGARSLAHCPDLPTRFRGVRFDDGLWLGSLGAEQRRALGVPKAAPSGIFASVFHGQQANLDVVGSIAVELRKSRAVAIHVVHAVQS